MNRNRLLRCLSLILSLLLCAAVPTGCYARGDTADTTDAAAAVATGGADTTAPQTEPVTEPEPEPVRVSFVAAGDNVVHPGIYMDARNRAGGGSEDFDFLPMYEEVRDTISAADIAFINQETLMCGSSFGYSGYPQFNSPQKLGYDLAEVGFDVVTIANNHMADKAAAGLEATISFWKTKLADRVLMIGGYENEADYDTVRTIERNGVTIAFLAYTYGTNGLTLYNTDCVAPYLDEEDIIRQTTLAKSASDAVVVSVHWGDDSVQQVTDKQKYYAQLFADCGVNVILGHHPHLIQPVTVLTGAAGNQTLCIYSLGNFISEMADAYNMVGGLFSFELCIAPTGKVTFENVLFTPTVFYYSMSYMNTHVYFMKNYSEQLMQSHGVANYGGYRSFETLLQYTRDIMGQTYLPAWMYE